MIVSININDERETDFADSLDRERRRAARRMMVEQFAELLSHSTSENLYWTESKTDLLEIAHDAYMSGMLSDDSGRPFRFRMLVRRACAVLHVPEPSNPYSMVHNARNRKFVRQKSIFSRYCWMVYRMGVKNPLNGMVKRFCNSL